MFFSLNYFNKTDEQKHIQRILEYQNGFVNKMATLATVKHDDIVTKSEDIMRYLFTNGHCGFAKIDGKIYCGAGSYIGKLDKDGRGKRYRITFLDGTTFEGEIGKDVVVFYLNTLRNSVVPMIERASCMLADIDLSMVYNIRYTRVCPIPIVRNDNEERSIMDVIKNLFTGNLAIFKRALSVEDVAKNGVATTAQNTLDLTQPQASAYMQNLSRFHDEIMIRACLEFGIHISARDKGAQLNDNELNAFEDYCIIEGEKLKTRLDNLAEDFETVFGFRPTAELKKFVCDETHAEELEKEENENVDNQNDNGNLEV